MEKGGKKEKGEKGEKGEMSRERERSEVERRIGGKEERRIARKSKE